MVASLPLPENMDSYEDYSEKIVKVLHLRTEVMGDFNIHGTKYLLDAATLSGILKAKQKLGRTFNSDKLGGIAFTKISKLTMCSA